MAGRKGRSGRKPLSIEAHLRKGTYRPDRHGPIPAETRPVTGATPAAPAPLTGHEAMLDGLGAAGRALVAAHLDALGDWNPRDLALIRQAGEARDRQVALQAAVDADGVVVGGEPHPALRAERQAGAAVVTALRALDIRPAPAQPVSRRA